MAPVELSVVTPSTGRGPVTTGVPWPRGAVIDPSRLALRDVHGRSTLLQTRVLDRWPDGSARWVLLDWHAAAGAGSYQLTMGESPPSSDSTRAHAKQNSGVIVVDTGAARFELGSAGEFPFRSVAVENVTVIDTPRTKFAVVDDRGRTFVPHLEKMEIEDAGPVRVTVCLRGSLIAPGAEPLAKIVARMHFFAGSATVRFDLTLHNPRRAAHPGGLWDLGDPGSVFLRDASLTLSLPVVEGEIAVRCSAEPGSPAESVASPFELYQDSSGGKNWKSSNHINRNREIPLQFRGYRLRAGGAERTGLRATPMVAIVAGSHAVGVTMPNFWQNFPKAVEVEGRSLVLSFFPRQSADVHELQPGEQKTHTFAVAFGPDANSETMEWFRTPARAAAAAAWYCASGAIPYLTPKADDPDAGYLALVDAALDGPDTFDKKREVIDEYGWRHFGDVYGDHEAVYHKGPSPLVSHYNNQYDPVLGFGLQYLRSGDPRWFRHMDELAGHVADIDVYHTDRDKAAYNGGLFWHTFHYADADTATHRSYPRSLLKHRPRPGIAEDDPRAKATEGVYAAGGGPANEQNYVAGLVLHYFLTGNRVSYESAVGLARWVIDMDDGRMTVFRWLARGDTGLASKSRDYFYHGPGRGSGNSLAALIDGHRLTQDPAFLAKAEQLIRRVIHPADDVAARNLLDVENRWFYTMFLHSLGRYLDHKAERGELDANYAYARASLLHYARWMAEHERPYLSKPEILEYPDVTWAAQDMRKCAVFQFAARHATGEEKARFLERADFFFRDSVSRMTAFDTRTLARPVILLLSLGYTHAHFRANPTDSAPEPAVTPADFGSPERFVPQKIRAIKRAKMLLVAGAIVFMAMVAGLVVWLLS